MSVLMWPVPPSASGAPASSNLRRVAPRSPTARPAARTAAQPVWAAKLADPANCPPAHCQAPDPNFMQLDVKLPEASALLRWNNAGGGIGYRIERKEVGGGPFEAVATVDRSAEDWQEFTDTTLPAGGWHIYRIRAVDDYGCTKPAYFRRCIRSSSTRHVCDCIDCFCSVEEP